MQYSDCQDQDVVGGWRSHHVQAWDLDHCGHQSFRSRAHAGSKNMGSEVVLTWEISLYRVQGKDDTVNKTKKASHIQVSKFQKPCLTKQEQGRRPRAPSSEGKHEEPEFPQQGQIPDRHRVTAISVWGSFGGCCCFVWIKGNSVIH